jgi:hypothetical protein
MISGWWMWGFREIAGTWLSRDGRPTHGWQAGGVRRPRRPCVATATERCFGAGKTCGQAGSDRAIALTLEASKRRSTGFMERTIRGPLVARNIFGADQAAFFRGTGGVAL